MCNFHFHSDKNLSTKFGLTNSSVGTIVALQNPEDVRETVAIINFPEYTGPCYPGLDPNQVPITASKQTFTITVANIRVRITRTQLPLVHAYALTDYLCQGSTINKGIIVMEIGMAHTQMQSLYVMFSRFRSFSDIIVIWPRNGRFPNPKWPEDIAIHQQFLEEKESR